MPCFRATETAILLDIKAVPGASRTQIAGLQGDRLRVQIAAAPEDGKANAALCAFLAKQLGCAKKDIVLQSGEKSRLKTVSMPVGLKDGLDKLLAGLI
jgi:uncharacterized protein (TIGR00251 family)